MQKISKLKTQLGSAACLSAQQSYNVKGGTDAPPPPPPAVEDDKRRERPGGLTSQ
ncbi:MAG: hypothetical protein RL757_2275 [Bacteroidota bacterium]